MSVSSGEWMHTTPHRVKVAFLQGLFESEAVVDAETLTIQVPVQPSYLNDLIRLLKDVGASPHVVGTNPITIGIAVAEAVQIPLFNPQVKSAKFQKTASLAIIKTA